jgi:hypothetical protein
MNRNYGWEGFLGLIIANLSLNLASGREGDSFDWFWGALAIVWFVLALGNFFLWYVDYRERKAARR